jgi:hypothetical protein
MMTHKQLFDAVADALRKQVDSLESVAVKQGFLAPSSKGSISEPSVYRKAHDELDRLQYEVRGFCAIVDELCPRIDTGDNLDSEVTATDEATIPLDSTLSSATDALKQALSRNRGDEKPKNSSSAKGKLGDQDARKDGDSTADLIYDGQDYD